MEYFDDTAAILVGTKLCFTLIVKVVHWIHEIYSYDYNR